MADEDKLKELEKALAQELDQKIQLTDPGDSRLNGTVQLNPTLDTSRPAPPQSAVPAAPKQNIDLVTTTQAGTAPGGVLSVNKDAPKSADGEKANATGQALELSLGAIDNLLDDLDGDFKKELSKMGEDIKAVAPQMNLSASITIGKDYLPEDDKAAGATPAAVEPQQVEPVVATPFPFDDFISSIVAFIKNSFFILPKILSTLPSEIRMAKTKGLKQAVKDFSVLIKVPFNLWRVSFHEVIRAFKSLLQWFLATSAKVKAQIFSVLILGLAALFLFNHLKVRLEKESKKDKYLNSFNEVAETFQPIKPEEESEDISSPIGHPEDIVLLKTVIASLKSESTKKNPMGRVEIYVEASNQDAAMEIKDREIEIRDLIARALEQSTFEELESRSGKNRFKARVLKDMNRLINRGRALRIYFKYFVVHPGV